MPVRSLNSAVFKWPDREAVLAAARAWAGSLSLCDPSVRSVFCVGSCARGDWGVGSDLDLVAVVDSSEKPFQRRSVDWDLNSLPVQADLLVYPQEEWERLQKEGGRFAGTLAAEGLWLFSRPANAPARGNIRGTSTTSTDFADCP